MIQEAAMTGIIKSLEGRRRAGARLKGERR